MTYLRRFEVESPLSAFGELLSVEPQPEIQVTFPYAINTDMATTATSGAGAAASWASGLVSLASGTANNGYATLTTKNLVRYGAGQGADVRIAAVFGTGTANNTQIIGVGDTQDGFFLGYNGTTFGVLRRSGGSDTWVAQSGWNINTLSALDTTKGNVYRITYQWLGFGAITFWVEDPATGAFTPVHRIYYANTATALSISNPSLPVFLSSLNGAAGTTSVTLKSGSMSAFVQGTVKPLPFLRYSKGNNKSSVTTETNIITLKVKATNVLGGTNTNRHPIEIDYLSVATEGNDPVDIRAVRNATLGGTPSYADFSTNTSVVQFDTAGTTVANGTEVFGTCIGKSGNFHAEISELKLRLMPGDTMTFSASSATNAKAFVRIGWRETQ